MFFEKNVLAPDTESLLHLLGPVLATEEFFLVGGTALAIQLGHRISVDLDFFRLEPFETAAVLRMIPELRDEVTVLSEAENSLHLSIAGVKVDLIRYAYPLIHPLIETPHYQMLSLPDIAAMKLSAVTNRGSKKDFFDLFELLDRFSLEELLHFYSEKFPQHDLFFVVRSLTYFEDADNEPEPRSLRRISWQRIKERFTAEISNWSRKP